MKYQENATAWLILSGSLARNSQPRFDAVLPQSAHVPTAGLARVIPLHTTHLTASSKLFCCYVGEIDQVLSEPGADVWRVLGTSIYPPRNAGRCLLP